MVSKFIEMHGIRRLSRRDLFFLQGSLLQAAVPSSTDRGLSLWFTHSV